MKKEGRWLLLTALAMLLAMTSACLPRAEKNAGYEQATEYRQADGKTGITGQVLLQESATPVAGAYVNLYPDAFSNLLGPSQFISSPTDSQGNYTIEGVPPGDYFVVARKRMSGQPTGPISPGDYYSHHRRIRASVVEGRLAVADLPVVPMKAPMFFKKSMTEQRTDTGIRGVLVDEDGKPVAGSYAIAYVNEEIQRVPDYASTLTDEQGNFTLYLPGGGTYFLAGRVHAWDMPRPGEPYGIFGGEEPAPLHIEQGSFVENVRIVMQPFTGTYKPEKSRRPY